MERIILRSIGLSLAMTLSLFAAAKCPPGNISLMIKQANGWVLPVATRSFLEDEIINAPYMTNIAQMGTIHIGAGDTVVVTVTQSSCGVMGWLTMNGTAMPNSIWGTRTYKCTLAGSYEAGSCDEGCNMMTFTIAPLAGAVGPVSVSPSVLLEGAAVSTSSSAMRIDLKNQGLLPYTEPYSALGYTYVGGGGGEVLGTAAASGSIVDWVVVELRDASQPNIVLASKAAVLRSNGSIVNANDLDYLQFNVVPGYYYVAVRHRSHLGVMTGIPVLLNNETVAGVMFNSSDGIPSNGTDALHIVGTRRFMWPGNSHWTAGAQQIKYTGTGNDRDAVLNKIGGVVPTTTISGYYLEDLNLDGVVKYTGTANDRDLILQTIGGIVPTTTRVEQIPY